MLSGLNPVHAVEKVLPTAGNGYLQTKRRIPMARISLSICLIIGLSLLAACNTEPEALIEDTAPTIKGVWTIEEMDVGTGDNRRASVPQAFMLFIMDE